MRHFSAEWKIQHGGRGLHELTGQLQDWLKTINAREGLVNLFIPHTSASLILQENADPDVQRDILGYFARLVPDDDPHFYHRNEGPDDMSAHLRCVLTQNSLVIPVREGRAAMGVWQGVFLFEHRTRPLNREILLSFQGETGES